MGLVFEMERRHTLNKKGLRVQDVIIVAGHLQRLSHVFCCSFWMTELHLDHSHAQPGAAHRGIAPQSSPKPQQGIDIPALNHGYVGTGMAGTRAARVKRH